MRAWNPSSRWVAGPGARHSRLEDGPLLATSACDVQALVEFYVSGRCVDSSGRGRPSPRKPTAGSPSARASRRAWRRRAMPATARPWGSNGAMGRASPGWGPQLQLFSWFDTDVQVPLSSSTTARSRAYSYEAPLGGHTRYAWVRGRSAITADLVGGLYAQLVPGWTRRRWRAGHSAWAPRESSPRRPTRSVFKPEVQVWSGSASTSGSG